MPRAHANPELPPILNTSLPPSFRQIRLDLAREPGHPEGAHAIAYVLVAPLAADGRIDPAQWQVHREACRVVRLRPGEQTTGHLIHRPGGTWAFHYGAESALPDESGHHFADERFAPGEYVAIRDGGVLHTFRVVSVARL